MEAQYPKWKLPQHRFQHRDQPDFADIRCRSYHLPLRHLVHGIDVVHPLDPLQISLMDRVDPQIPRPPLRVRPPPVRAAKGPDRRANEVPPGLSPKYPPRADSAERMVATSNSHGLR